MMTLYYKDYSYTDLPIFECSSNASSPISASLPTNATSCLFYRCPTSQCDRRTVVSKNSGLISFWTPRPNTPYPLRNPVVELIMLLAPSGNHQQTLEEIELKTHRRLLRSVISVTLHFETYTPPSSPSAILSVHYLGLPASATQRKKHKTQAYRCLQNEAYVKMY